MFDADQIETRYAKSGELNIAYQLFGKGDVNVVVLIFSTVKDLVAGSEIAFADLGRRALKGMPEAWQLYRAAERAEAV